MNRRTLLGRFAAVAAAVAVAPAVKAEAKTPDWVPPAYKPFIDVDGMRISAIDGSDLRVDLAPQTWDAPPTDIRSGGVHRWSPDYTEAPGLSIRTPGYALPAGTLSTNIGNQAPENPAVGSIWIRHEGFPPVGEMRVYDGSSWRLAEHGGSSNLHLLAEPDQSNGRIARASGHVTERRVRFEHGG